MKKMEDGSILFEDGKCVLVMERGALQTAHVIMFSGQKKIEDWLSHVTKEAYYRDNNIIAQDGYLFFILDYVVYR